jgi:hypothetical protein
MDVRSVCVNAALARVDVSQCPGASTPVAVSVAVNQRGGKGAPLQGILAYSAVKKSVPHSSGCEDSLRGVRQGMVMRWRQGVAFSGAIAVCGASASVTQAPSSSLSSRNARASHAP